MPTNLPPDALEAERRYREAETVEEKVACLEEYISLIPKHKGTDHLRADLRRKLSKLKAASQSRKGAGKQASVFHIDREGAGQVVVVGMTNVGKSSLVTAVTNASPEISEVPYSTWEPTPGMMVVKDVPVQLIDTPPLSKEYVDPEFMNLVRRADFVLVVVDLRAFPLEELEDAVSILEAHRIVALHRQDRYDAERRVTFKPFLVVVNKADDESFDEDFEVLCELLEGEWPLVRFSALTNRNFEELEQAVFERLDVIRVYAKPPGRDADLSAPFVMKKGGTVEDFAAKVHKDFLDQLKAARVWGSGAYDGQTVSRDYVLHDGDVVELRT
jgi:ribosome-interacting GTPase 1